MPNDPIRILALDVGAGTQDILIFESDKTIENSAKLILPSQTQVVARRVEQGTMRGQPIHLAGHLMGGGANSDAILAHLQAGLTVTATPEAARTLHNDLERVKEMGIRLSDCPPRGAQIIWLEDVDLQAIESALRSFEIEMPSLYAIGVQDHGYLPGAGGREFRYEFLQSLLTTGGDVREMVFQDPPDYMLRMKAVSRAVPGAVIMDTGAAAVVGILGDARVAEAARTSGAILLNIGNLHTFGVAIQGQHIIGLFEHHTGGINSEIIDRLVRRLQTGQLTHAEVVELGGHGAAFGPGYGETEGFSLVAITGPNRHLARELNYHEAVPHGDMMLSGAFGLAQGMLWQLDAEGRPTGISLIANQSSH